MNQEAERAEFYRLSEDRFHYSTEAEWDAYYQRMSPYIKHPEAHIRAMALERLSMAVMRAEKRSNSSEQAVKRLQWLLGFVEQTRATFSDIGTAFLYELRYHGDDEPFDVPLRDWLHRWLDQAPNGDTQDVIRGTLTLLGDCGSTWEESAPQWLKRLDDPSNYVRGCAAKMLGKFSSSDTNPSTVELFALIKTKEIARPGIAGPFWSGLQFDWEGELDVVEWMMDILENRHVLEPPGMPFNGVDFYLHELCESSPAAIDRMLKCGTKWLALETATETRGVVDGMKEKLLHLGDDPNPQFARGAWEHLARYYRTLHPSANDPRLVCELSHWDDEAQVLVIRRGDESWEDVMVIYPKETESEFDEKSAWRLIDKALPAAMRGVASKNTLGIDPDEVPYRLDNKVHYQFDAGPIVTLEGDPDRKRWFRIDIIGRGLQNRWDPR